jgi:hypothetical protein
MVPVIPFHRSCWRLRAQGPGSPLARLVDASDLAPLQDMIQRTRIMPLGSRFSDGSFRPTYAALERRTCMAE